MYEHYVYIYLNPLKRGNYDFGKFHFDYEPFYVGIGKGKRIDKHIIIARMNKRLDKKKSFKDNIILKILSQDKGPIRYKLYKNITLDSAKRLEIHLIRLIGRRDLNEGSLVNHTIGGDGTSGFIYTDKLKKLRSKITKSMWENGKFDKRDISGINGGFYGKSHTKESIELMVKSIGNSRKGELNANHGNKWTDEQRKKASIKHKEICSKPGYKNPMDNEESRRKVSKSKMGIKNPNGVKWELISPEGKKHIILGGIKRELKKYDLNYQQFRFCYIIDGYRLNKVKKDWKLKKLDE